MEAWKIVDGGLVSDGVVKDVSCFLCCSAPVSSLSSGLRPDSLRVACISQQTG